MELDMSCNVDLNKVNTLIHSNDFIQFLLSHTTDIGECAYILQNLEHDIKRDGGVIND